METKKEEICHNCGEITAISNPKCGNHSEPVEMETKKETNLIEWGNGHKKYIKNKGQAELFAYHKAFYFETKLNGNKVNRKF